MYFYDSLYERNLIKTHSLTFYLIGAFWLGIVSLRIHTFAGSKSIANTSLWSSMAAVVKSHELWHFESFKRY